jgi:phage terminase small subunit
MPLKNERHQRFCERIASGMTGAEAVIAAGYSPRSARNQANRMMTNDDIQTEIERLKIENRVKAEIDAERVTRELAAIAFSDITDLFSDDWQLKAYPDIPHKLACAIASIKITETPTPGGGTERRITVRMHDKLRVLDNLATQLGLKWDDQHAINVLLKYGSVIRTENGYRFRYDDGLSADGENNPQNS